MAAESPEIADRAGRALAAGQRLPDWQEDDLREVIPDAGLRRAFLAEMQPRPAEFFEEPIQVFTGWPDAPCGYLQFSHLYDFPAAEARRKGWPYRRIEAGHMHMLVDPPAVDEALLALFEQMPHREQQNPKWRVCHG